MGRRMGEVMIWMRRMMNRTRKLGLIKMLMTLTNRM